MPGPAPIPPDKNYLNRKAAIPFGVTPGHIFSGMTEFADFLTFIDAQLQRKKMDRFEEMLMPAGFSSMLSEFMGSSIPKYSMGVVKNCYHNGHPDLLPAGKYPKNCAQHAGADGIEIKASRYLKAWQGHNAEDAWLMVFVYESGRPSDAMKGIKPKAFQFLAVVGALLSKSDWIFAGRSATSRRTITASVTDTGYQKMMANWIYKIPNLGKSKEALVSGNTDE